MGNVTLAVMRRCALALLASLCLSCRADAFEEHDDERANLVRFHIVEAGVTQPEVVRAMERVPRHRFIPANVVDLAYEDRPLPIGYGQTISQPFIVAYMTEALGLSGESKVLEIGTGSAYQAAVLGEITRRVYTIEIISELAASARKTLDSLGYGFVVSRQGDGYYGWEEAAPFDAIIVTAAVDHVPPPLIAQLAPGGVMIIPVGSPQSVQVRMRIRKHPDGSIERDGLLYVRFVPLTGERR